MRYYIIINEIVTKPDGSRVRHEDIAFTTKEEKLLEVINHLLKDDYKFAGGYAKLVMSLDEDSRIKTDIAVIVDVTLMFERESKEEEKYEKKR